MLTLRKGTTEDLAESLFAKATHLDEYGITHAWDLVADTDVEMVLNAKTGESFGMGQVSLIVPKTKGEGTLQIHILTTLDTLDTLDTHKTMGTAEIIYRLAARWRQENYFRFGWERFALNAHHSYVSADDDAARLVQNPAKAKAKKVQDSARAHPDSVAHTVASQMLEISTPEPGGEGIAISNRMHNDIHAPLVTAQHAVEMAEDVYQSLSTKIPLGESRPGTQVLDTEMKHFTHIIRMAAFNTAVTLAREIRINTGYKRAKREAHNMVRKVLTQPGDIDPTVPGFLSIILDPMPTKHETCAVAELCESLTETRTRYPGTELVLRYAIKEHL